LTAQTSVEDVADPSTLTNTATTTYIIIAGVLLLAFTTVAYVIFRRQVAVEKVHPDGENISAFRFLKNKVLPHDLHRPKQEREFEGIENATEQRPERAAPAVGASSIRDTLYGYLVRHLLVHRVADISLPCEGGKVADFEEDDTEWRSPPKQTAAISESGDIDLNASSNSYLNDEDQSEGEQQLADYMKHIAFSSDSDSDSDSDDNILAIAISSDSSESDLE
jgi:hypothetical protein